MKKSVLFLFALLLTTSVSFAQITVLDDFETGVGHFGQQVTFSGSTVGISGSGTPPSVDSVTAALMGTKSLKIEMYDNAAAATNWEVRFLSGGAAPANNVTLDSVGHIGYWLKTDVSYLSASIGMDAPGTGTTGIERADPIEVIGDGQWHLYQWDLADTSVWNAWALAGSNGIIEKPVTIDALWFFAPDSLAASDTAIVWLDYVSYNPTGVVPAELASFTAAVSQNVVDLRWITATEKNNRGFEVERKAENGFYEKLAFVDGKGTSTDISSYVYSDAVKDAGKYSYRLKQVDFDGSFEYSKAVEVEIVALPGEYTLAQNYPNPFNPVTSITFNMPEAGMVNLAVYNLLGEKVTELVNDVRESGLHSISFDAASLASGTYIYTLNVNGNSISKKMVLMK